VEKYCRVRQATDDGMAHALCMLDTKGYKYTLRLCNTDAFPLQQQLHEHTSVLHDMCIACLVTGFKVTET